MEELLFPTSVAVIGATSSPMNLAKNIIQNLRDCGFQGPIHAVGQGGGEVHGLPVHGSVLDIREEVDFAAILIPAEHIPGVLAECGQKGIRRIMISSGGFEEFSDDGAGLGQELLRIAERYGIRFLGPNCIGIINLENGLCLPFTPVGREYLKKGPHSILAQSGGVCMRLGHVFSEDGLGFSKLFSVGNKLNIDEVDLLEYLIADPQTEQIFLYLEGVDDLRTLMELARSTDKPIVVWKSNRYAESHEIAHCHTAALASDDRIIDAGLRQAGIPRAGDQYDMVLCAKALKLPPLRGGNLGVISMSGGVAVLIADACRDYGFTMPPLPRELIDHIEKHRRGGVIRMTNPLDFGDIYNLEMFRYTVEEVMKLDYIDGMLLSMPFRPEMAAMIEGAPGGGDVFESIFDSSRRYDKPIAISFFTEKRFVDALSDRFSLPIYDDAVDSVRAMAFLRDFTRAKQKTRTAPGQYSVAPDAAREILEAARAEGRRELFCHEAIRVLEQYGISAIETEFAADLDQARTLAAHLGYPLAMKVVSPQISHKSDLGGVVLDILDESELAEAFERVRLSTREAMPEAELKGVTLQKMASAGQEMILGAESHASTGHAVMLGMGGTLVEILDDVSFRIPPLSREEVAEMIEELRGYRVLAGFRGTERADLEALRDAILRLAQLLQDFPEIEQIDINPLVVFEEGRGLQALDSRVVF